MSREFKSERIGEGWSGYAKDMSKQIADLEVEGWKVINLQKSSTSYDVWVWLVRDEEKRNV